MAKLKIERLGGLAGFGLPGSRIKSRGQVALADLSAADRATVESLFKRRRKAAATLPDAFHYRITLTSAQGDKTVDAAEHELPEALRDAVRDELE